MASVLLYPVFLLSWDDRSVASLPPKYSNSINVVTFPWSIIFKSPRKNLIHGFLSAWCNTLASLPPSSINRSSVSLFPILVLLAPWLALANRRDTAHTILSSFLHIIHP